jgi:collagenase-like PrtC family protease
MKLVADLKSVNNIGRYQVDGLVFASSDFSCSNDGIFSWSEIEEIVDYCHKYNLISILNIDRIIEEDELSFLYENLEKYLKLKVDYYIFSDFAILDFFKKHHLEDKLIYDPKTLITNVQDALFYKDQGIKVAISNELSFDEILQIAASGNTVYELYGHHQMFYSKRALLSNFSKSINSNKSLENTLLQISEEKRADLHPIYQSPHGTFIYTSYRYTLLLELPLLKDKLIFGRINTTFIEEEEALEIISLYHEAIKSDEKNIPALYEKLKNINPNIGRSFLDRKSVLLND